MHSCSVLMLALVGQLVSYMRVGLLVRYPPAMVACPRQSSRFALYRIVVLLCRIATSFADN